MDNCSHINNPAFAPPPRGHQVVVDDQSPLTKDLSAPPHSNHDVNPPLLAPRSTTTDVQIEKDLAQLGISANLKDTSALVTLGNMYSNGEGVPQNYQSASYPTALEWYIKAASQGNLHVQGAIGLMYNNCEGDLQDFGQAVQRYLKAAKQGHPGAPYGIGLLYSNGEGVPQDFAKAMEWYRMAADQGDTYARCKIGIIKIKNQGVTKSCSEARKYFQKAADQRHPDAQNWLKELSITRI
ncbi:hypothetical protein BGX30_004973 [Mortierella sp. GBA39]|nr:hypothetical protein BGX30_004973 [Mortierella sp. GBA39]